MLSLAYSCVARIRDFLIDLYREWMDFLIVFYIRKRFPYSIQGMDFCIVFWYKEVISLLVHRGDRFPAGFIHGMDRIVDLYSDSFLVVRRVVCTTSLQTCRNNRPAQLKSVMRSALHNLPAGERWAIPAWHNVLLVVHICFNTIFLKYNTVPYKYPIRIL